jgi:hypothetical protein
MSVYGPNLNHILRSSDELLLIVDNWQGLRGPKDSSVMMQTSGGTPNLSGSEPLRHELVTQLRTLRAEIDTTLSELANHKPSRPLVTVARDTGGRRPPVSQPGAPSEDTPAVPLSDIGVIGFILGLRG